jgi:hypothetical protein
MKIMSTGDFKSVLIAETCEIEEMLEAAIEGAEFYIGNNSGTMNPMARTMMESYELDITRWQLLLVELRKEPTNDI